jgi:hypothetical protein
MNGIELVNQAQIRMFSQMTDQTVAKNFEITQYIIQKHINEHRNTKRDMKPQFLGIGCQNLRRLE